MPPVLLSSSHRRWRTLLWILVPVVLLLGILERFAPGWIARTFLPTGEARWIWKSLDRNTKTPLAFYAARDFELTEVPAGARLLALADEEYVLHLNGKRVGSGSYRSDSRLDVYAVGSLLRPGTNRLVAELRSSRGSGGFLALLVDTKTGEPLAWTDESWTVFDRYQVGLVRGWTPLRSKGEGAGEPAFVWGFPPVGRWGSPSPGAEVPLFATLSPERRFLPGRPLGGRLPDLDARGSRHVFDFGQEVTGYLSLDLPPGEAPGMGLLFTGLERPDPMRQAPAAAVLVPPGSPGWTDARPRRFRYAVVLGLERPVTARVRLVDAARAASLLPTPDQREEDGVLGIDPPPLRTPVEDEVWREFKRVPGVAGREEL
ncbi:MAG TPA: hypothetical protein VHN15_14080 [Thermoanaerobaculia bacterium]|nr:hypothetical protein [Thermoanaerobaculia bacterium]